MISFTDQLTYDGAGFHSGPKSFGGEFSQTFNSLGTATFASDPVDDYSNPTLVMSGSVIVSLPDEQNLDVLLALGGIVAAHFTNSSNTTTTAINNNTTTLTFGITKDMTVVVTDVEVAETSAVTTSMNRGHLQGINKPTFYLSVIGSGSNSSDQLQIGTSTCNISDYVNSTKICTILEPLASEFGHPIKVIGSNKGFGVIDGINSNKYFPISYISGMTPLEGSKGGGNSLTITGSGFESQDQTATVIYVGPDQNPQECRILSKTDQEIRCTVPTAYKNYYFADMNATIYVRIGSLQYPPAQENGEEDSFIYKFSQRLTSEVHSISNSSTSLDGGTGSIQITGSGFGNDTANVMVSLIAVNTVSKRRLKQTEIHKQYNFDRIEHKPLNQLHMSSFFSSHLQNRDRIHWRVGGSGAQKQSDLRNFDRKDVEKNPFHSGVSLLFEDDFNGDPELERLEGENYRNFVHRHKRSTLERSILRKSGSMTKHMVFRQAEIHEPSVFMGNVTSVTNDTIEMFFDEIPAGSYIIQVTLATTGNAINNATLDQINSVGKINSIMPKEGSILGGQSIKIIGSGFHEVSNTEVSIGGISCQVTGVTIDTIECVTGEKGSEELDANVEVYSGMVIFPTSYSYMFSTYNYSDAKTPLISNFSLHSGMPGDNITLYGTILDTNATNLSVQLGDLDCSITGVSNDTLQLKIPELPGGMEYPITVHSALYGNARVTASGFTVEVGILSISPTQGSKGGGTLLTLSGFGFDTSGSLKIYVCQSECKVQGPVLTDTIECLTPIDFSIDNETVCTVNISQLQDQAVAMSPTNFTYSSTLTPVLTDVSPSSGGSGGGTRINITGEGFDSSSNMVRIGGSICDIISQSTLHIVCDTNSHVGSGDFPVEVFVPGKGNAALPANGNGTYQYVDYWSSIWTWGGLGIPEEGDFVVIESGQEIVLDVSTPKLGFLLLKDNPPQQNMFGCEEGVICKVALKTYHGTYVVAEINGDANANSHDIGELETWIVNFVASDKVTLKSLDGKYLMATSSGGAYANSDEVGDAETFTVGHSDHLSGQFTFQSTYGLWLAAESWGDLNANRGSAITWEAFDVIPVSGGKYISIQSIYIQSYCYYSYAMLIRKYLHKSYFDQLF